MIRRVGIIGVGAMGMGIAISAARAGFEVHARDVDPRRQALAREHGFLPHDSCASLIGQVDACVIVVVDAAQIDEVLHGPGGLVDAMRAQPLVLLCSTIAPGDGQRFAEHLRGAGARPIDAPISGGPARAEAGTMSMMLAAPDDVLDAARPLLEAISGNRFVIGAQPGMAAKAKLVNNLMAGINLAAGAEALALAGRLGLAPAQMLELIRVSSGQSWMFEDRMSRALAGDYAPRAQSHVLTKDLTLANQAAEAAGVSLPLGAIARDMLRATCDAGWRDEDDAAIYKLYRDRFGLDG